MRRSSRIAPTEEPYLEYEPQLARTVEATQEEKDNMPIAPRALPMAGSRPIRLLFSHLPTAYYSTEDLVADMSRIVETANDPQIYYTMADTLDEQTIIYNLLSKGKTPDAVLKIINEKRRGDNIVSRYGRTFLYTHDEEISRDMTNPVRQLPVVAPEDYDIYGYDMLGEIEEKNEPTFVGGDALSMITPEGDPDPYLEQQRLLRQYDEQEQQRRLREIQEAQQQRRLKEVEDARGAGGNLYANGAFEDDDADEQKTPVLPFDDFEDEQANDAGFGASTSGQEYNPTDDDDVDGEEKGGRV